MRPEPKQTAAWIVCQIGAREHYVLASELHRRGRLAALCTDAWVRPGSAPSRLAGLTGAPGRSLRERYAPDLAKARIINGPLSAKLLRDGVHRWRGLDFWRGIMAANEAFGAEISARLGRSGLLGERPIVFSYSYAARQIFHTAKKAGCRTVLGQIDPGLVEDQLVAEVARRHGIESAQLRPPQTYWEQWREECELADHIVVNSPWSRDALIEAGIAQEKIAVIPLACAPVSETRQRSYPAQFTRERPLRLLFLGQVNIRKGAFELLEAMEQLCDVPVRLSLVGNASAGLPQRIAALPNVEWLGPAARGEVGEHYRSADAFILPTHSDGFALTQLEAAAHGLPLIVSRRCGQVATDGVDGLIVYPVDTESIEAAIRRALHPGVLAAMSSRIGDRLGDFSRGRIVDQFEALVRR